MISINRRLLYGQFSNDVRCLSTDEKPTADIANGSVLTEIDTGKTYMFDGAAKVWYESQTSGGGGTNARGANEDEMQGLIGRL